MSEEAVRLLAEDATLWSVGEVTTGELALTACDALVFGADSQALRELAGASEATSAFGIEELLRALGDDFGFEVYQHDTVAGRLAASRILAAQCVDGRLAPRDLARWMHTRIGHGHEDRWVEALVSMDDRYDLAGNASSETMDEVDGAVLEAARHLLRQP